MDTRNQVKQYVDMAWRRKWWIVIPVAVGAVGSLYYYKTAPKVYRASTTILVTRQSVPEEIVRSTVTTRIDERMKSLKIQVLSRRYLEQVGREEGLITETTDERGIERVCDQIEASVILDWDKRDLSWVRLMVHDKDPQRAARIANRLVEMTIDQNTEQRAAQASGIVNQIDLWVRKTDAELRQRDDEIAKFKRQNMYELPDQEGAALQLLSASQNRVSQLSSDIQLRSDRLSILRSEEKASRAVSGTLGVSLPGDDPDSRQLAQLERELNDLLINYTDENPLVRKKRDAIAQFKELHPTLSVVKKTPSGEVESSPEIRRLQAELRSLENDRTSEQGRVDELRRRIGNMPMRAQELAALTRDYDMLKKQYDTTVGQKEQARRFQDLEEAKKGEQFQIQDHARAPAGPYEPVLMQLLIMGLAAGAGIGVGLAALLEFLDQSVRGEEQFAVLFPDIPIIGSIPNLVSVVPAKPRAKGGPTKKAAAGGRS